MRSIIAWRSLRQCGLEAADWFSSPTPVARHLLRMRHGRRTALISKPELSSAKPRLSSAKSKASSSSSPAIGCCPVGSIRCPVGPAARDAIAAAAAALAALLSLLSMPSALDLFSGPAVLLLVPSCAALSRFALSSGGAFSATAGPGRRASAGKGQIPLRRALRRTRAAQGLGRCGVSISSPSTPAMIGVSIVLDGFCCFGPCSESHAPRCSVPHRGWPCEFRWAHVERRDEPIGAQT